MTIILGLGLFTCCILPTCSVIHTLLNPSSLPSRESLEFPGYSVSEVERAREQMAAEAEAQREAAREAELRLRIEDEQRRARERR